MRTMRQNDRWRNFSNNAARNRPTPVKRCFKPTRYSALFHCAGQVEILIRALKEIFKITWDDQRPTPVILLLSADLVLPSSVLVSEVVVLPSCDVLPSCAFLLQPRPGVLARRRQVTDETSVMIEGDELQRAIGDVPDRKRVSTIDEGVDSCNSIPIAFMYEC